MEVGKGWQHQSSQGIHILKAFHHAVYIKKIHLVCVVWGSIPQFTSPLNQLRHCTFAVNRSYGAQCDQETSNVYPAMSQCGFRIAWTGTGPKTSNPYPESRQSIFHPPQQYATSRPEQTWEGMSHKIRSHRQIDYDGFAKKYNCYSGPCQKLTS